MRPFRDDSCATTYHKRAMSGVHKSAVTSISAVHNPRNLASGVQSASAASAVALRRGSLEVSGVWGPQRRGSIPIDTSGVYQFNPASCSRRPSVASIDGIQRSSSSCIVPPPMLPPGVPPPRKLSVALAVWLDTAQMDHDSGQGSETFEPDFEAQ